MLLKPDHDRRQFWVIHPTQWLREATRTRFMMDDDVAAKAMVKKYKGGHAPRDALRGKLKCVTIPFRTSKTFQPNVAVRSPQLQWHFWFHALPRRESFGCTAPSPVLIAVAVSTDMNISNRIISPTFAMSPLDASAQWINYRCRLLLEPRS